MSEEKCETCRFTCKHFLKNCRFYSPERRKKVRETDDILKQFWDNIYAHIH